MESIAIIIILVAITFFLWKIATKESLFIASNGNEWIALVVVKYFDEVPYDYKGPVSIEFYPIIGWNCSNITPIPITPFYNIGNRLKADFKKTGFITNGFLLKDGLDYGIDDSFAAVYLNHHFWVEMSEYASSGYEFVIEGRIPDCCQKSFLELLEVSENNRARNKNIPQTDT